MMIIIIPVVASETGSGVPISISCGDAKADRSPTILQLNAVDRLIQLLLEGKMFSQSNSLYECNLEGQTDSFVLCAMEKKHSGSQNECK